MSQFRCSALFLLALCGPALSDELEVTVQDDDGKPVEHAVVYARPVGAHSDSVDHAEPL